MANSACRYCISRRRSKHICTKNGSATLTINTQKNLYSKMKTLYLFLLSLTFSYAIGQPPAQKFRHLVGTTADSTVQVIFESIGTARSLFITFEGNPTIDTIFLPIDAEFQSNTCKIDQIQIDGMGRKEIHITWKYQSPYGFVRYIGNQQSWGKKKDFTHHEIWNLDTKECIFSATSSYSLEEYTIFHSGNGDQRTDRHSFWNYHFSIDEAGKITISKALHSSDQTPDHTPGKYIFVEGKYRKE